MTEPLSHQESAFISMTVKSPKPLFRDFPVVLFNSFSSQLKNITHRHTHTHTHTQMPKKNLKRLNLFFYTSALSRILVSLSPDSLHNPAPPFWPLLHCDMLRSSAGFFLSYSPLLGSEPPYKGQDIPGIFTKTTHKISGSSLSNYLLFQLTLATQSSQLFSKLFTDRSFLCFLQLFCHSKWEYCSAINYYIIYFGIFYDLLFFWIFILVWKKNVT